MNWRLIFLFTISIMLSVAVEAFEMQKKIIYVDSYHPEYRPNILTRKGFQDRLSNYDIKIQYEFMDAKRRKTAELQKKEALRIKEIITAEKPDLIVAADDSASKYLISPYYKNKKIPVVFCGINWDASSYGFPAQNITGQVEVELISELLKTLRRFSKGNHLGLISGDTLTDRKSIRQYSEVLGVKFDHVILVDTMQEWKKEFVNIQKHVDILVLRHKSGIKGWVDSAAEKFIIENTVIPTGSITSCFARFVLICLPKMNYEFGEIAAEMAEKILFKGISPSKIPLRMNKKSNINLNMVIAKKLGIKFPVELLKNAHLISEKKKKLLHVNSSHKGYLWGDDSENESNFVQDQKYGGGAE